MKKLLVLLLLIFSTPGYAADKESAYERVIRTGTIRCAYMLYDPVVKKDPNSGEMSGILVDVMAEAAKRLSLKMDWADEISFVTGFESLKTGHHDLVCTALWGWPEQARVGELIGPMYYYPIGAWVRADDRRFDQDLSALNAGDMKISGVDGTFPLDAARIDFPKAQAISLPQGADYTQPLMEVVTKKADITFMDNNIGLRFLQANPGSVRNIAFDPPYKIFGQFVMADKGEHALQTMLQSVVNIMVLDGSMDRILTKYESRKGAYYRLPTPYAVTK